VGRFLRHSVLHYYILLLLSVLGRPLQVTVRRMLRDRCPVCPVCNVGVGMGDAAPPTERDSSLSPTYRPMSLVAKRSPISETAGLLLFNRLSFTELGWARTPNRIFWVGYIIAVSFLLATLHNQQSKSTEDGISMGENLMLCNAVKVKAVRTRSIESVHTSVKARLTCVAISVPPSGESVWQNTR